MPSFEPSPDAAHVLLSLRDVFAFLFVMLGPPLKTPAVYAMATRKLTEPDARRMAFEVFVLATIAVLAGGLVGVAMMQSWHVSQSALMLAAGLIFLLVSLRSVLEQYEKPVHEEEGGAVNASRIAVPGLATPYGVAAVVLLVAAAPTISRAIAIAGLVVMVMLLNLLAMIFARPIMRTIGPVPLRLFGVVAGVLMIGLSIQILVDAVRRLGLHTVG